MFTAPGSTFGGILKSIKKTKLGEKIGQGTNCSASPHDKTSTDEKESSKQQRLIGTAYVQPTRQR
jgi:hypothetical protein